MYKLKVHLHGAEKAELELEGGREYTFGRGADCSVQLEEHPGISRVHFRVALESNHWTVQVMSKFGHVHSMGRPVQHLVLEPDAVFKLGPYDFTLQKIVAREQEQAASSAAGNEVHQMPSQNLPSTVSMQNMSGRNMPVAVGGGRYPSDSPADNFGGNDEATRVMQGEAELPFVRVIDRTGKEQTLSLEGRRWTAGREEGCYILLNDRKSSRRQFELSSTAQGYFIRDLGSSNGTLLNGIALASDELKPIRSGDVIQVGSCVVHFEIRDPNFEKKLMVVPPQVRPDVPIVVENRYEMINYPVPSSHGGAVRVSNGDNNGLMGFPFGRNLDDAKRKKMRFWLIVAAVLIPLVIYLSVGTGEKHAAPVAKLNSAFEKLSPKSQQSVKEIYVVAMNLYMNQKLALAAEQLKKLHEILPEGFENSLAMAQECSQQAEYMANLAHLEEEKRRQEEILRKVESTLRTCEPLSRRSARIDEMNHCLEPALNLDPENPRVREMLARVQQRIELNTMKETEARDYRARVSRGKNLYDRAYGFETRGEYLDALEAYKKHLASGYPDPENLKAKSERQSFSIQKKISSKIDDAIKGAEAAYAVGNIREAIDAIKGAKKLDPHNDRAAELNGKYRRELTQKMREIYEEAVISEGLGQIDDAKARWKKIVDTDHPDGEYFRKAKDKLRMYGQM